MIKIRASVPSDFDKLEELLKDNPLTETFHATTLHKIACSIQFLIPHNFRFFPSIHVAVEGKNILGFVILRCASKENNSWQINEVYVTDEMRNKGVGEELIRYVLSVYGGYGIEHFLAEIDSQNFPALSLFHQCGFRRYARYCFYEKEIDVETLHATSLPENEFILRQQLPGDLSEIEKLGLASIPADLRPALGRSKEYFSQKKDAKVLVDKSRNLIIGWAHIQKLSGDHCFIELLTSPGWTHLYEQFLNTIVCDCTSFQNNNFKLTVKVFDYITELTQILTKSGFLAAKINELLVRTIWQKVKERKLKTARVGVPRAAPT